MHYRTLGSSPLEISLIGLGTMTWGEQNSAEEAFAQLDFALERGVNFIDTAELYPVPPRAETYTQTEEILGRWLSQRGGRDRIVLASKVVGRGGGGVTGPGVRYVRGGQARLDRRNIEQALEGSLRRLRCDYLDLYQLHWPDRSTNFFGRLGYTPEEEIDPTPIEETLEVLDRCVAQGKVRYIGLSNETPWGVMRFLQLAKERGWPRVQSIQNPYNLLNRSFEVGLAEIAHREQCGLLAYSPLAFGVLSGKYLDGSAAEGARLRRFAGMKRYSSAPAQRATTRYVQIAKEAGLDPAQMALAFVNTRPFVSSNIIGATSLEQLRSNIESVAITLSPEVIEAIESVHREISNPSP